jgi:hypothetical protein
MGFITEIKAINFGPNWGLRKHARKLFGQYWFFGSCFLRDEEFDNKIMADELGFVGLNIK